MNLLSEVSQKAKDKYHDITYMGSEKMIQIFFLQNRNRFSDIKKKTYSSLRGNIGRDKLRVKSKDKLRYKLKY